MMTVQVEGGGRGGGGGVGGGGKGHFTLCLLVADFSWGARRWGVRALLGQPVLCLLIPHPTHQAEPQRMQWATRDAIKL